MSYFESPDLTLAGLTVTGVMESPAVVRANLSRDLLSAVTPAQQRLLDRNAPMIDSVVEAYEEAREAGKVIASSTLWNAKRFLQLLPQDVPVTDAYISDAESICFDWDEDFENQLSVMVQREGRIAFAANFGGVRFNGATSFTPTELPRPLASTIARWSEIRSRGLTARR